MCYSNDWATKLKIPEADGKATDPILCMPYKQMARPEISRKEMLPILEKAFRTAIESLGKDSLGLPSDSSASTILPGASMCDTPLPIDESGLDDLVALNSTFNFRP